MGLINRFLLCLYTLSFAVLALGVAALVLQLVPERYIWNEFQFLEDTDGGLSIPERPALADKIEAGNYDRCRLVKETDAKIHE